MHGDLIMQNFQVIASKVAINENQISAFCQRWKITVFSLFESVLRDDF